MHGSGQDVRGFMVTAEPDNNGNGYGIRRGIGPNAAWKVTVGVGPSRTG